MAETPVSRLHKSMRTEFQAFVTCQACSNEYVLRRDHELPPGSVIDALKREGWAVTATKVVCAACVTKEGTVKK